MRLATFNCNSVRSRLGIVLDWLAEHRPDVLALQETRVGDDLFPRDAFAAAGWRVAFRGEKGHNGVAVVSRAEPDAVDFGLGDGRDGEGPAEGFGDSGARLMCARFGGVHVVNAYVPQGRALDDPAFAFKLAWLGRLRAYFAKRFDPARDRVAWVGDLNVAPTDIDVHDHQRIWPHVCHCAPVIEAFAAVTDWGFADVFRRFLPAPGTFTFWDYRQRGSLERNRGWRIDHVLATRALAERARACRVDLAPRRREKPSDHTVVVAEFDD